MMCFLVFLLVTMSLNYVHGDSFLPVTNTCKYWDPVSVFRTAKDVVLHCILDESYNLGIVNTTWKLVSEGQCPIFNRHTGNIDFFECNEDDGRCSTSVFASYQATQFSGCMKENRLRMKNIETSCSCASNSPGQQLWFPIIAAVFMVIWVSLTCYNYCRHGSKLKKLKRTIWNVRKHVKKKESQPNEIGIESGDEGNEDIENLVSEETEITVQLAHPEDSTSQGKRSPNQEAKYEDEDADCNTLLEILYTVGKGKHSENNYFKYHALQIFNILMSENDKQYKSNTRRPYAIPRKMSMGELSKQQDPGAPIMPLILAPGIHVAQEAISFDSKKEKDRQYKPNSKNQPAFRREMSLEKKSMPEMSVTSIGSRKRGDENI